MLYVRSLSTARRRAALAAAAGAFLLPIGCRSSCDPCGERRGFFARFHDRHNPPCQLVGMKTGSGVPVSGPMVSGPTVSGPIYGAPPAGLPVLPGAAVPPADELPRPQPSGLIPTPAVPFPAPADPGPSAGGLFPKADAVPVKNPR